MYTSNKVPHKHETIPLRERTISEYTKMINRYPNINIQYPQHAYDTLREMGLKNGYIKNVLCAFKWKTGNTEYSDIIKKLSHDIKSVTKTHINKFNKINWIALSEPTGFSVNDVIMGLYTMFPPRRVTDYAFMIYQKNNKYENNQALNYYIETSKKFIFQNYKTVTKYKVQTFIVPDNLHALIKNYAKQNELHSGEPLLKFNNSNKFSKQTLMRRIKKIFGTSIDGIRHSYITHLYKNYAKLFDIEDTSLKMAHDVKTHLSYLDKENNND